MNKTFRKYGGWSAAKLARSSWALKLIRPIAQNGQVDHIQIKRSWLRLRIDSRSHPAATAWSTDRLIKVGATLLFQKVL